MCICYDEAYFRMASLRWKILRQTVNGRTDVTSDEMKSISRKHNHGYGLIPMTRMTKDDEKSPNSGDVNICYHLPIDGSPKLSIVHRADSVSDLRDFQIANSHNIDNTGIVCHWPSEEVLAYFCLTNVDMFKSKRVLELGCGYGLAALTVAASSDASEVVLSDGNPKVLEYAHRNVERNRESFGRTEVRAEMLHWDEEEAPRNLRAFDFIIASDCTFFKDFHKALVRCIRKMLKVDGGSEAVLFSPRRGDSLEKFLEEMKESGLQFAVDEKYDAKVWERHVRFTSGDASWPSYESDHCYPFLIRIKP